MVKKNTYTNVVSQDACSKNQEPVREQPIDEFTYTDKSNAIKTVKHTEGKWEYGFDQKISFELKLSIKTLLASKQTINAYILKNIETVYGDVGYNQTDITYNA